VGAGKQVFEFHKNQHVFEQGDVADTVFYIQKGKIKLTVMSESLRFYLMPLRAIP
jgi:CRP/FNR family transcriptional regulator, cyclic AMP receptor protein